MSLFKTEELNRLIHWIRQRELVRHRKEVKRLPAPWTEDKIIQHYRFCNVRRMDDKVSRWLQMYWYDDEHTPMQSLIMAAWARLLNWPDSLECIGDVFADKGPFAFKDAERALFNRKASGEKIFTGAYIINGAFGGDKITQIRNNIEGIYKVAVKKPGFIRPLSMRATHANLCGLPGIGSFMAGQIVADLRFTSAMSHPDDAMTWAPLGPGSKRGIRRLMGLPADGPVKQKEFDKLLPALIDVLRDDHDMELVFTNRKLEAMDIQNCLCEFDKYTRLLKGEGTVRNRYNGAA